MITTDNVVDEFLGNGVTTVFPSDVYGIVATQFEVYLGDADLTGDLLTLTTDYTISNLSDMDEDGVVVTMVVPPANGEVVRLYRRTDALQQLNVTASRAYDPQGIETQLDLLTMALQEAQAAQLKALRVRDEIVPMTPEVGAGVEWDGTKFIAGPTSAQIAAAQAMAAAAQAAQAAAELAQQAAEDAAALAATFDPALFVALAGTQTVTGAKTFGALLTTANIDAADITAEDVVADTLTTPGLADVSTLRIRKVIDLDNVNMDTVLIGGEYFAQANCANLPFVSGSGWFVQVRGEAPDVIQQFAMRSADDANSFAQRLRKAGVWGPWRLAGFRDSTGGLPSVGTAAQIENTSIPGTAKRFRATFSVVSADAAPGEFCFRLRTTGIITAGYSGNRADMDAAVLAVTSGITDRFVLCDFTAASATMNGFIEGFRVANTNIWDVHSNVSAPATGTNMHVMRGRVDLGAAIGGIRLYTTIGLFDNGFMGVDWET